MEDVIGLVLAKNIALFLTIFPTCCHAFAYELKEVGKFHETPAFHPGEPSNHDLKIIYLLSSIAAVRGNQGARYKGTFLREEEAGDLGDLLRTGHMLDRLCTIQTGLNLLLGKSAELMVARHGLAHQRGIGRSGT
jgi:hypothetical protein